MKKNNRLSFIETIWVFIIGGILGYIVETFFYLIKYHHYVNKQGLIYGPFKPIYGLGAIILTYTYYLIKNKSNRNIFIFGMITGSVFEYIASLVLEYVFKSYIWDYSKFPLNINGRVYLPYVILWGLLSLIWIKLIYLPLKMLYDRFITKRWFKIVSVFLVVFIIFDILLTTIIMIRQGYNNKSNYIFKIVDKIYSQEQIKKKFPKFRPIK